MNRLLFAIVLLCSPVFAQSWSGQSSSDARVVPPYKLCVGLDNGQDACFIQSGSLIARLNGQLDFALVAKTVATLPPASLNSGRVYRVTDGVTGGDCTIGGAASFAVCISTGSIWTSLGTGASACLGGTCLLTPGLAGIVVSNGVNGNTSIAGTGDINGALGYTAANDILVVHTTGIETVAGAKTFVDNATFNGNLSVQGTLNIGTSGPFFMQGAKQSGAPTVGASYDYGLYVDTNGALQCLLRVAQPNGTSCFFTGPTSAVGFWNGTVFGGESAFVYGQTNRGTGTAVANLSLGDTRASPNGSTGALLFATVGNVNPVFAVLPAGIACPFGWCLGLPAGVNGTFAVQASAPLVLNSTTGNLTCPTCLTGTQYTKLRCDSGLGDGLNAMTAGTYLQSFCYNDSGVTWTITGIKCFTDNSGTSTLNATNGAGTGLLTGAVTCTTAFAAGTQSGTTTIAAGDFIKFTFAADGTSKQSTWVVSMTQ